MKLNDLSHDLIYFDELVQQLPAYDFTYCQYKYKGFTYTMTYIKGVRTQAYIRSKLCKEDTVDLTIMFLANPKYIFEHHNNILTTNNKGRLFELLKEHFGPAIFQELSQALNHMEKVTNEHQGTADEAQ